MTWVNNPTPTLYSQSQSVEASTEKQSMATTAGAQSQAMAALTWIQGSPLTPLQLTTPQAGTHNGTFTPTEHTHLKVMATPAGTQGGTSTPPENTQPLIEATSTVIQCDTSIPPEYTQPLALITQTGAQCSKATLRGNLSRTPHPPSTSTAQCLPHSATRQATTLAAPQVPALCTPQGPTPLGERNNNLEEEFKGLKDHLKQMHLEHRRKVVDIVNSALIKEAVVTSKER